jgi:hypothetical protein
MSEVLMERTLLVLGIGALIVGLWAVGIVALSFGRIITWWFASLSHRRKNRQLNIGWVVDHDYVIPRFKAVDGPFVELLKRIEAQEPESVYEVGPGDKVTVLKKTDDGWKPTHIYPMELQGGDS